MPIFPEIGQVAHPSLDADTALFYAHLSRKARTGERGIAGDGGKKRESGSRPFCDSDGFRACMSARERERDLARLRGGGERGDHGNNGGSDIRRGGRRRSAAPIGAAVSQSVRR